VYSVGLSKHPSNGVEEVARSGWRSEVEVVLFGGAAWWSSATDLPPSSRSQLPGAVLRALPSPVALERRCRVYEAFEGEDVAKHDDGDTSLRLFGVEDRRLPIRRGTSSDPRRHGRSSAGTPAVPPVYHQRPQDLAGPS
jgi:hypothetical protein